MLNCMLFHVLVSACREAVDGEVEKEEERLRQRNVRRKIQEETERSMYDLKLF